MHKAPGKDQSKATEYYKDTSAAVDRQRTDCSQIVPTWEAIKVVGAELCLV